jgi:hypothetical protein
VIRTRAAPLRQEQKRSRLSYRQPVAVFADRFDASRYAENEPVELRAYRGKRRASTYREHVVPEELFVRTLLLASAYELHQLPTLDQYGPFELNKEQARRVDDEVAFLSTVVNDVLLAPHLEAISAVAAHCWRHSGDAWLHIEGP